MPFKSTVAPPNNLGHAPGQVGQPGVIESKTFARNALESRHTVSSASVKPAAEARHAFCAVVSMVPAGHCKTHAVLDKGQDGHAPASVSPASFETSGL